MTMTRSKKSIVAPKGQTLHHTLKALLSKDEQPSDIAHALATSVVSDLIKRYLTKRLNELERIERSQKVFENPNWPFQQAHVNGSINELKQLQTLLTKEIALDVGQRPE